MADQQLVPSLCSATSTNVYVLVASDADVCAFADVVFEAVFEADAVFEAGKTDGAVGTKAE